MRSELDADERFELGQFFNTNSFDNKPSIVQQMRNKHRPASQLKGAAVRPISQPSRRSAGTPQRPFTSSAGHFVQLLGIARKDKNRVEITGPIGHLDRRDPGFTTTGVKTVDEIGTYDHERLNKCGLRPPRWCTHQPERGTWARSANGSMYLQGPSQHSRIACERRLSTESAPSWTSSAMSTWRGGLKSWAEEDMCSTYMRDIAHQPRKQTLSQEQKHQFAPYTRTSTPTGPPDTPLRYHDTMLGTVLDNTTTKTNSGMFPTVLQIPHTNPNTGRSRRSTNRDE